MEKILEEPINNLNDMEIYDNNYTCKNSWAQEFEKQLNLAKEHGTPDIIVLTGGASRMSFIIPICEKLFPYIKDKIFRDLQPELSISKGLAIWGYTDFTSQKFESEVKQVLDTNLEKAIEKDLDKAFEKIAKDMIDDAMGNVVIPKVKLWQTTSDSISMLKKDLEIKLREWNKSDRVINLVNEEFAQYLVLTRNINKDYLIGIAKKYKILNPDTVLDASNRIVDIFKNIEIFKDNPLEQALEKIQQELADEISALIILMGGLIIAALWAVGIGIAITAIMLYWTITKGPEEAQRIIDGTELPYWLKGNMVDKLNNKKPEITEKVLIDLKKNTVIRSFRYVGRLDVLAIKDYINE